MTTETEAASLATVFSPRPINYPTERGSPGFQRLSPACNLSNGTGWTHLSRVRAHARTGARGRTRACDSYLDPVPLEKKQVGESATSAPDPPDLPLLSIIQWDGVRTAVQVLPLPAQREVGA